MIFFTIYRFPDENLPEFRGKLKLLAEQTIQLANR